MGKHDGLLERFHMGWLRHNCRRALLCRYNEFGGGANPNAAPICNGGAGTPYTVSAPNGRSITVKVLDKCQACDNDVPHIDLTAGAFQALGYDLSKGVIKGVVYGPAVRQNLSRSLGRRSEL